MKVRVSAYLTVSSWTDPISKITFDKSKGEIEIPNDVDLTNIKLYVRQNYLTVLSGSIEELESKQRLEQRVQSQKDELQKEQEELAPAPQAPQDAPVEKPKGTRKSTKK